MHEILTYVGYFLIAMLGIGVVLLSTYYVTRMAAIAVFKTYIELREALHREDSKGRDTTHGQIF